MAESTGQRLRGLRIVVGGLMSGLTIFSAITLFMGGVSRHTPPELTRSLLIVLALMAMACAVGYAFCRRALIRGLSLRSAELRQQQDPVPTVVEPYSRFVIQGAGLIEGPGFFAAVVFLITRSPFALGGMALALLLLAAHFPSSAALRRIAEAATQAARWV